MNERLHKDINIDSDTYGVWDITLTTEGLEQLTDTDSLENGVIIAVMTRLAELTDLPTYTGFGCRVHELIKANMNSMTEYKLQSYINDTVSSMHRVKNIDKITITRNEFNYDVVIDLTCISGETTSVTVSL